ncbi:MAG: ferrous iron transport protein B [Eubacterium sp.]|jgi:ferrous iron transport protein B|nr:ferrous iron transport protein B [Eubacterium sp.]
MKPSSIVIALAGNQNSGKTTLFNRLTGLNLKTSNFPGVTVEQKKGELAGYKGITIVDLPGVYSLSPNSGDEILTRDFLMNKMPSGIINIIDTTNIERNLYLTLQLLELKIPMVLALNMMDEVEKNQASIDTKRLRDVLKIPVVPISAVKNEGVQELSEQAVYAANNKIKPGLIDFYSQGELKKTTKTYGDKEAAKIDLRYKFIDKLCWQSVVKSKGKYENKKSFAIDSILTHKVWAYPIFLAVIIVIFYLTFGIIGNRLSDLLVSGLDVLKNVSDSILGELNTNPAIHSLIIDGIFSGVGTVLGFAPIILTLFFFLSILEDSGYMTRIAFIMDKPLRKIGLSGLSAIPLLLGFGCTAPAVMATRTIPGERSRKMTVLLTPFMSCGAKIPVYALFSSVFFQKFQPLAMTGLYVIGIFSGILSAFIMRKTIFKNDSIPFLMELPTYRIPIFKSVVLLMWVKAWEFIRRSFTVILAVAVTIWFFGSFDTSFSLVDDSSSSMLAGIGNFLGVIFKPLGFYDWRAIVALITGFTAKEAVISTFAILFGLPGKALSTAELSAALHGMFSPLSAFSFLIFTLLYSPCVTAIAAIKRELGNIKEAFIAICLQTGFAWLVAFCFYQLFSAGVIN